MGVPVLNSLLVIDDDETLLQSISCFFSQSGSFEVTTACPVPVIPDTMVPAHFDAVILGFDILHATGFLKKIRREGDMTPVILFCKEEGCDNVIEALNSGASFYLVKGSDPESQFGTLFAAVEGLVRQGGIIRELRESEARYRDRFENAPDMYLSVDASTGTLIDCNNAVEINTGYSREEMIGRQVLSFYHPDSVSAALRAFEQFKTTGIVRNVELQIKRKDGSTLDVLLNATAVRDQQGKVLYSRSSWSDITMYRQAQKNLRESEERFRLLYDAAPLGYQSLDSEGRFIEVNQAWLDTLGYSREEVIGHWFGEFLLPEGVNHFSSCFPKFRELGEIHHVEFEMVKRDGSHIIVSFDGKIAYDDQGTFRQTHCILSNITDQKRAESLLRESETRFRLLYEAAPLGYQSLDSDGRVLVVNQAWLDTFGYNREEVIGHWFGEFLAPEDQEKFSVIFQDYILEGALHGVEFSMVKKDGSRIIISFEGNIMRDREGKFLQTHSILTNITDRKHSEQELRESEEKYRLLIQNINDAVFVFLPDDSSVDRIIEVNDRGCQMLGYSRDELPGMRVCDICCADGDENWAVIRERIITYGHAVFQTIVTDRNKHDIPVEVSARIFSLHGRPVILAIVRDISERKMADEALALAAKKLALMSSITRHDILNQLGLLDGYLSLAEKSSGDPVNFDRFMEKVHKAVQAIQHQITFTRLYQELGVKAPAWVSVNDCIEKARGVIPAGKIKIESFTDRLEVFADPLFEKIFNNLIDNALRYGGESMTVIRFSAIGKDDKVVITCEDNGTGMTAAEKEHLFERGYGKHTGLGLFLSREILSITGMTIEETSTAGHGARFEITVPAGGFRYTG